MLVKIKPTEAPLVHSDKTPMPTVAFAVEFEIPDAMFKRAEQVIAELTIPQKSAIIAADVKPL